MNSVIEERVTITIDSGAMVSAMFKAMLPNVPNDEFARDRFYRVGNGANLGGEITLKTLSGSTREPQKSRNRKVQESALAGVGEKHRRLAVVGRGEKAEARVSASDEWTGTPGVCHDRGNTPQEQTWTHLRNDCEVRLCPGPKKSMGHISSGGRAKCKAKRDFVFLRVLRSLLSNDVRQYLETTAVVMDVDAPVNVGVSAMNSVIEEHVTMTIDSGATVSAMFTAMLPNVPLDELAKHRFCRAADGSIFLCLSLSLCALVALVVFFSPSLLMWIACCCF